MQGIKSEAGASWYRAIPLLKRGQPIFALYDADGRLIAIADSRRPDLAADHHAGAGNYHDPRLCAGFVGSRDAAFGFAIIA